MFQFIVVHCFYFFFNATPTTVIYTYFHTLSLHDALPISAPFRRGIQGQRFVAGPFRLLHFLLLSISERDRPAERRAMHQPPLRRSEEHTSELQSLMRNSYAVFCLKKKQKKTRV